MKSQKRVVVVVNRAKDFPEDLLLLLNLLHLLLLQLLQHDHHLRRLEVFNQLHQHLLLQHQGDNTSQEYPAWVKVKTVCCRGAASLSIDQIGRVQKLCKYAISALDYQVIQAWV